jgi:hypothetical protein
VAPPLIGIGYFGVLLIRSGRHHAQITGRHCGGIVFRNNIGGVRPVRTTEAAKTDCCLSAGLNAGFFLALFARIVIPREIIWDTFSQGSASGNSDQ